MSQTITSKHNPEIKSKHSKKDIDDTIINNKDNKTNKTNKTNNKNEKNIKNNNDKNENNNNNYNNENNYNEQMNNACNEKSFMGNMIKKLKEGFINDPAIDNFKNELLTSVYDEIYIYIYPHYITFFALMVAILFLEILIFLAIFATVKLRN